MTTITKRIITVVILLLVGALAFYPKLKPMFSGKPDEKGMAGGPGKPGEGKSGGGGGPGGAGGGKAPVDVMVVNMQSLDEKILTTGTVIPNEEVEIRSEISGRVTGIFFKEGQYVKKGTILLRIQDADLQAQLQKLTYNKQLAETNESRQKKLLEKEAISRQEYDIAQTNLNSILADIENLKVQISKAVIKAPFDGTIGLRYISNGSYISPSSRIATLTNVNPAKIDFSVPAKYAQMVRQGSRINFTVEGSTSQRTGTVYAVEPKVDPETRTLLLRAVSPNGDRALVPGAFARINVVLNSRGNAIVVPTEAIIPEQSGQKVFVVRNHKAEPVSVETGIRTERTVEIRRGLHVGDSLITAGVQLVKPGGEVDVRNIN